MSYETENSNSTFPTTVKVEHLPNSSVAAWYRSLAVQLLVFFGGVTILVSAGLFIWRVIVDLKEKANTAVQAARIARFNRMLTVYDSIRLRPSSSSSIGTDATKTTLNRRNSRNVNEEIVKNAVPDEYNNMKLNAMDVKHDGSPHNVINDDNDDRSNHGNERVLVTIIGATPMCNELRSACEKKLANNCETEPHDMHINVGLRYTGKVPQDKAKEVACSEKPRMCLGYDLDRLIPVKNIISIETHGDEKDPMEPIAVLMDQKISRDKKEQGKEIDDGPRTSTLNPATLIKLNDNVFLCSRPINNI